MAVSRPVIQLAAREEERTWRFAEFELDATRAELRRAGQVVTTSSLSALLLDYLVRNRERMVGREELVSAVWRGIRVSDGTVRQAIWELRRALDDTGEAQRFIRTVRGHGYRFVGALREPPPVTERPSLSPASSGAAPARPLFGRTHELGQLEAALEAALAESGRACVVRGEAGIGKTRLVRELVLRARERGIPCFDTAASPEGAAPALWPWRQLLEAGTAALGAEAQAALRARFPAALRAAATEGEPTLGSSAEAAPGQQRFLLLAELGELFVRVFAERPCLVLVEDLQWADEASLSFIGHVATLLGRTRMLLVGTARTVRARDHRPLAAALEAVRRGAFGQELELGPLGVAAISDVLALHGGGHVTAELAEHVHALSRGNALFVNELALLLARSHPLPRAALADLELRTVLQRRLQSLPEPVLALLRSASVLSSEFSLGELASLLESPPNTVLMLAAQALAAGALLDDREPRLRFAHPLVKEAAYALLDRPERARLHGLAGEWLERDSADVRPARLNELAHHFVNAAPLGYARQAVTYSLRCAEQACAATAYQDALAHYDRCLVCMDLDPAVTPEHKLEVALLRGEAMRASGADTTQVNRYFLELAERAERLGDTLSFARAVLGFTGQRVQRFTATRFMASEGAEGLALIERALLAVGPAPSELRALLLCSLLGNLVCSLDGVRRQRAADEARRIADILDRPALTVRVLATCIYCCGGPGDLIRQERDCDALIACARAHGLCGQEADALITRAFTALGRGEPARADADAARAGALARRLGSPQVSARSELLSLMRSFWTGDLALAKQLTQRALAAASEDLRERAMYMLRSSTLQLLERGNAIEHAAMHEQWLGAYPDAIGLHCALASMNAVVGKSVEARLHFDAAARDDFAALPEDLVWLSEMGLLADAAYVLDDGPRARQVYRRLLPYGRLFAFYAGEAVPAGPVAQWLAALATTTRDFAAARRWLDEAQALNARLGATMFTHYALLLEARLLLASEPDQAPRARALTERTFEYAHARGLRWLVHLAEATMEQLRPGDGARAELVG